MIPVQKLPKIHTPDGNLIIQKPSMEYLGSVLHADGSQDHEINRRIGCAKADFRAILHTLTRIWWKSFLKATVNMMLNRSCLLGLLRIARVRFGLDLGGSWVSIFSPQGRSAI